MQTRRQGPEGRIRTLGGNLETPVLSRQYVRAHPKGLELPVRIAVARFTELPATSRRRYHLTIHLGPGAAVRVGQQRLQVGCHQPGGSLAEGCLQGLPQFPVEFLVGRLLGVPGFFVDLPAHVLYQDQFLVGRKLVGDVVQPEEYGVSDDVE